MKKSKSSLSLLASPPRKSGKKILIKAIERDSRHFEKSLEECRKAATADRIHALRISTRRLLTDVILVGVTTEIDTTKVSAALKRTMKATARSRDIHVELRILRKLIDSNPTLKEFFRHLRESERRALRSVKIALKNRKLARRVSKFGKLVGTQSSDEISVVRGREALSSTICGFARLTDNQRSGPKDLHGVRLVLKKIRYFAESFSTLISVEEAGWINAMRPVEKILGDIHDLDVLIKRVRKYDRKHRKCRDFEYPTGLLQHSRQTLFRRYAALRSRLMSSSRPPVRSLGRK